uniref:Uncharacterized protein n=1 Tax=Panagrolaimus sp. JU765 TaxID=591449 RepID=A0AC34QGQ0_9BILA
MSETVSRGARHPAHRLRPQLGPKEAARQQFVSCFPGPDGQSEAAVSRRPTPAPGHPEGQLPCLDQHDRMGRQKRNRRVAGDANQEDPDRQRRSQDAAGHSLPHVRNQCVRRRKIQKQRHPRLSDRRNSDDTF